MDEVKVVPISELDKHPKEAVVTAITKVLWLTGAEVERLAQSAQAPVVEVIVARLLMKAYQESEFDPFWQLLDRAFGKVPQPIELTGPDGAPLIPGTIAVQTGGKPLE